ncbi:MAG: hypothetical protein EXS35_01270 [Pedosphaera sp.]|nr:hypothetical protein [Pedosphaera sp.]
MNPPVAAARDHRSREAWVVCALVLAVFVVNLLTGTRFPAVWLDEVQYTDPAVNLYLGHGFTSTAWFVQTGEKFWAAYVPLHQFVLYGWMQIFGFSPLAVRSLNYTLVTFAVLLLWHTARKQAWIPTARARILLVLLVLLDYGVSICTRSGRYDGVVMLLAAAATWASSFARPRARLPAMAALAAGFPFAGLQLTTFTAAFCVLLVVFTGWRRIRECLALAGGGLAGSIGLRLLYQHHGVWDDFLASIRYCMTVTVGNLPKDPSLIALFAVALLLVGWRWRRGELRFNSPLVFGITGAVWIGLWFHLLGRFPTTYTWMAYVPLAIGVCATLPEAFRAAGLPFKITATTLLTLGCAAGLPLQLASTFYYWPERDYAKVEAFIARHVHSDDSVYSDPEAYYTVKKTARHIVLPSYLAATPEENARLNVLVLRPYHAEKVMARLGGRWTRDGETLPGITRPFFFAKPDTDSKLTWDYNLEIWRKQPEAETHTAR